MVNWALFLILGLPSLTLSLLDQPFIIVLVKGERLTVKGLMSEKLWKCHMNYFWYALILSSCLLSIEY